MTTGHRIIITGASGWLGKCALNYLSNKNTNSSIDSILCFGSKKSEIKLLNGFKINQFPIEEILNLDKKPTILLHFAFLTKDRVQNLSLNDYFYENNKIDNHVLSSLSKIGIETIVLSSSGAIYSNSLNMDKINPYGYLKIKQEEAYIGWANKNSKKLIIPRIFNLSGMYINKLNHYAIASMIIDAKNKKEINIKSRKLVYRSYSAVENLIELLFCQVFDKNQLGIICYDVSGNEVIELASLAERILNVLNISGVPITRENCVW